MVATAAPPRRQRRVKLKSNSSTVGEYRYDALGRRVEKSVTGATYRYIYSGVETVSVYTSTGTWKQDYVCGADIDEVLMLEQADVLDADGDSNTSETARSWYLRNALGSVMEVLEQDKTEAVSYRYDPYGNVTITRGGNAQSSDPLGQYVTYTGRWRDQETGLYYYRARTYDPVRGRFLQRDPLGVEAGGNLYAYVDGAPASATDPSGLEKKYLSDTGKSKDEFGDWSLIFTRANETKLETKIIKQVVVKVGNVCYEEDWLVEIRWRKYKKHKERTVTTMHLWEYVDVPNSEEWPTDFFEGPYKKLKEWAGKAGLAVREEWREHSSRTETKDSAEVWELDDSRLLGAKRGAIVPCPNWKCFAWDPEKNIYVGPANLPFPGRPGGPRPGSRVDPWERESGDPLLPPGYEEKPKGTTPYPTQDPTGTNPPGAGR